MSKKTKIIFGIVVGLLVIGLIAFLPFARVFLGDAAPTATILRGEPNPAWHDGTYIGHGVNKHGAVELEVMIENGKFHHIKALGHNDTSIIFDRVFRKLTRVMMIKNSTEVDGISGATISSNGIINAVNNAVEQATNTTNVSATATATR